MQPVLIMHILQPGTIAHVHAFFGNLSTALKVYQGGTWISHHTNFNVINMAFGGTLRHQLTALCCFSGKIAPFSAPLINQYRAANGIIMGKLARATVAPLLVGMPPVSRHMLVMP